MSPHKFFSASPTFSFFSSSISLRVCVFFMAAFIMITVLWWGECLAVFPNHAVQWLFLILEVLVLDISLARCGHTPFGCHSGHRKFCLQEATFLKCSGCRSRILSRHWAWWFNVMHQPWENVIHCVEDAMHCSTTLSEWLCLVFIWCTSPPHCHSVRVS